MSEQEIVNETIELVKDAQKQGTFNLADVIKGRGYPTKDVTIYTDVESAFKLVEIEAKLNESADDTEAYIALEAEAKALAETVQASKLIFTMRGVNQATVEHINETTNDLFGRPEELDDPSEWSKNQVAGFVASNIVRVTDADGNVDERLFTREDALELRGLLPADSWHVLVATMQKLTLASGFFDGLTDSGFLPKS